MTLLPEKYVGPEQTAVSELFKFTTLRSSAAELSFWDEWWDTGRPVEHSLTRRFGAEELWPLLKQKFKNKKQSKIFAIACFQ